MIRLSIRCPADCSIRWVCCRPPVEHSLDAGRAIQNEPGRPRPSTADLAFAGVDLLIRDVLPAAADASPAALEAALALVDRPAGGTILGYGARFERGENLRAAPVVSQWRSGALVVVWPPSLATAALEQGSPLAR
ncbi:MAG: hypothetical protein U0556_17915 [Dehalococcoidia bacterium]